MMDLLGSMEALYWLQYKVDDARAMRRIIGLNRFWTFW